MKAINLRAYINARAEIRYMMAHCFGKINGFMKYSF